MSNAVLTLPPGLAWDSTRDPVWSTSVKTSVAGREYRNSNYSYPLWKYKLKFEFLRARAAFPEMQALAAFYNARSGAADTWLHNDVDDNSVTAQQFGVGDGTTKIFQLVRSFGGYTEPVFELNAAPQIYVNGTLKTITTDYTVTMLGGAGVVTFVAAPAAAAVLTWTGTYYWRCRFMADNLTFQQFMRQFWALGALEFITVKP